MKGDVQVLCKMWRLCLYQLLIVHSMSGHPAVVKSYGRNGAFSLPSQSRRSFETSVKTNPAVPRRIPEHPIPQQFLT